MLTLDHGAQEIRWIGSSTFGRGALQRNPKLCPVRIPAGALGHGLPAQDLVVSRQHRVLLRSPIAERMFGSREVLVPAFKLVGLPGVEIVQDLTEVTYWHLLFDNHEIVTSNGALTESLLPGPQAIKSLSPEAAEEIRTIFPELFAAGFDPAAAREKVAHRAKLQRLFDRHAKNAKPLFDPQLPACARAA